MLTANQTIKYPLNKTISFNGKRNDNSNLGLKMIPDGESIVYFSDFHSNISKLPLVAGIIDAIQDKLKGQSLLKVCAGDFFFGKLPKNSNLITTLLNKMNLDYIILGNHEFDIPMPMLKILTKLLEMPILVANFDNSKANLPIKDYDIKTINGEKFATIGITTNATSKKFIEGQMDIKETIKVVQDKVDELTKQGVKKIMLLSHLGIENDTKLAKQTQGVDIIISSHDHYVLDGIKKNINLFNSKANEPVAIFQAAQDNDYVGYARVKFDKDGVLTKIFNRAIPTFTPDVKKNKKINQILTNNSYNKVLAKNSRCIKTDTINYSENALANWITDSIKSEIPEAQIVLMPSRMVRTSLPKGDVTLVDINEILPNRGDRDFEAYQVKRISGKKIYQFINRVNRLDDSPFGRTLVHASGMTYSVNKELKPYNLKYVDGDRKTTEIKPDSYYNVAIPGYIINSGKFDSLKLEEDELIVNTYKTANFLIRDYLTKNDILIKPEKDGRVKLDEPIVSKYVNVSFPSYINLSKTV